MPLVVRFILRYTCSNQVRTPNRGNESLCRPGNGSHWNQFTCERHREPIHLALMKGKRSSTNCPGAGSDQGLYVESHPRSYLQILQDNP